MAKKRHQPTSSASKEQARREAEVGTPPIAASDPIHHRGRMNPFRWLWSRITDFSGLSPDATYLWPRWLVLRAVGLVFVFVFAGIIVEARALIAPNGIAQLDDFFHSIRAYSRNRVECLLIA